MKLLGLIALLGYVGTIFAANWLIVHVGIVDVGFGLHAPAAVYAAGAALTLRDVVQRTLGRVPVVGAIVVGAALSALVAPSFAIASGVAFLVSELCDFGVYTPLSERSWLGAITLSNTVGLMIDSALFLWLSPLSVSALFVGQVVGKLWVTGATVLVIAAARALWPRPEPQAA